MSCRPIAQWQGPQLERLPLHGLRCWNYGTSRVGTIISLLDILHLTAEWRAHEEWARPSRGKWELANLRIGFYQQRAARYYNSKVKVKRFQLGDLVFKKVLQNTQEVGARALRLNWEGPYKIVKILQLRIYWLVRMDDTKLSRAWNAEHLWKYYQ